MDDDARRGIPVTPLDCTFDEVYLDDTEHAQLAVHASEIDDPETGVRWYVDA